MTRAKREGTALHSIITAFCTISNQSIEHVLNQIINALEDFDTIMFKHGEIEMFYSLNNNQRGTLTIC